MLKNLFRSFFTRYFIKKPYSKIDLAVEDIFLNPKNFEKQFKNYSINIFSKNSKFNLQKIKIKQLNYDQLIFLAKFLFSQAQLKFSNQIRNEIKKKLERSNPDFNFIFLKIKFLIEDNKLKKARQQIEKKLYKFRNYANILHDLNLLKLIDKILKKSNNKFININPVLHDQKEINYGNFLDNKKIIIVGPGFSKKKFGKKIDSFDIVVRFNQFKPLSSLQQLYFGSKTHIVYFNGNMTRKININNLNKFLKNKWICSRLNYTSLNKFNNFRSTRKLYFNPIGAFGFLQDALIDILHFNPKSIFITNINFGLGKKLYWSSYSKANKLSNRQMYLSQSKLDLLSSINFIKVLRKNNVIKTDKDLAKILNLNSKELLLRFKKNNPLDEVVRD